MPRLTIGHPFATGAIWQQRDSLMTSRRSFAAAIAGGLLTGCASRAQSDRGGTSGARLKSRPGEPGKGLEPGVHPLELRRQRDTLLYVPKLAHPEEPAPLVVYLHGATGSEQQGIRRMGSLAEELGFLLLSPASADGTWDGIQGAYGMDVRVIDVGLKRTFETQRVDAKRIAVCGFSDGASYALGLGLSNGDLFSAVMGFSTGFIPPGGNTTGKPRLFMSHGTNDEILPIDRCSRRLVPELKRAGYAVTYREFEGPHTVPPEIAAEAMKWFLS